MCAVGPAMGPGCWGLLPWPLAGCQMETLMHIRLWSPSVTDIVSSFSSTNAKPSVKRGVTSMITVRVCHLFGVFPSITTYVSRILTPSVILGNLFWHFLSRNKEEQQRLCSGCLRYADSFEGLSTVAQVERKQ